GHDGALPWKFLRRPNYGSRRGWGIEAEAGGAPGLPHFRAREVVQADPPEQHALEVLDDLDLFDERRGRLQVVAAGVARRAIRVLRRGVLEPRPEKGVARDRYRLAARSGERGRRLDGVRGHAEWPRRGALAELEDQAIEPRFVCHADSHELCLIAGIPTGRSGTRRGGAGSGTRRRG